MTGTVRSRVAKLERVSPIGNPDDCDAGFTYIVFAADDPIPPDAARCPKCGAVHPVLIVEEIVPSTADPADPGTTGE